MEKNIILHHNEIQQKTKRIAYQILEVCSKETSIVIAGIVGNGFVFATAIQKEIEAISDLKCKLCEVQIDKKNPRSSISTTLSPDEYKNQTLILVDDVLNSGSTLIYGIKHFLEVPLKQFKTAVLVNRNHKKYPVKADFKGISLSTSLQEHVHVEFGKNSEAYLL